MQKTNSWLPGDTGGDGCIRGLGLTYTHNGIQNR